MIEYTTTKDSFLLITVMDVHSENASKKYMDDYTVSVSKEVEDSKVAEETPATGQEDTRVTDESAIEKSNNDWLTMMSVMEEDLTEVKYGEQRNVEDIKAISFQVPPPPEDTKNRQRQQQETGKNSIGKIGEETRKPGEIKKNQSRPANNLLLPGKSTKAFYEIKPSIRTLDIGHKHIHQHQATTHRTLSDRKFILPSIDSAFGKFGPYFEDGDREMNITSRIGSTILLDCKIGMLGDKKVRVKLFR